MKNSQKRGPTAWLFRDAPVIKKWLVLRFITGFLCSTIPLKGRVVKWQIIKSRSMTFRRSLPNFGMKYRAWRRYCWTFRTDQLSRERTDTALSRQSRLPSTPTFPLRPSIRNSQTGKSPAPSHWLSWRISRIVENEIGVDAHSGMQTFGKGYGYAVATHNLTKLRLA